MKTMNKKYIRVVIAAGIFAAAVMMAQYAIRQSERAECAKWVMESVQFDGYEPAEWQIEQCAAAGIQV